MRRPLRDCTCMRTCLPHALRMIRAIRAHQFTRAVHLANAFPIGYITVTDA